MSVESLAVAAPSGAKGTGANNLETIPTAPFDTLRDYIAAMEAHGQVVRLPRRARRPQTIL